MQWSSHFRYSVLLLTVSVFGFALSCIRAGGQTRREQPSAGCPAQPSTIRAMRNCYRPLLVFAPSMDHPQLVAQSEHLKDSSADLKSRSMLYVPVVGEGHIQPLPSTRIPTGRISQDDVAANRLRFHVQADQFLVVLIGKDGGEKFRSDTPVTMEQLKRIIDSMPMRQEEMQNKSDEP